MIDMGIEKVKEYMSNKGFLVRPVKDGIFDIIKDGNEVGRFGLTEKGSVAFSPNGINNRLDGKFIVDIVEGLLSSDDLSKTFEDLGWIERAEDGFYILNPERIHLVGFSGDFAEEKPQAFIEAIDRLSQDQTPVIITASKDQRDRLAKRPYIKDNSLESNIVLIEDSKQIKEWSSMIQFSTAYDFKDMTVTDIIANKELIIALSQQK